LEQAECSTIYRIIPIIREMQDLEK
jgi:hypothetical protein